jgi:hypothetical protein
VNDSKLKVRKNLMLAVIFMMKYFGFWLAINCMGLF